jgi:tetratricopeptide (TPR) repeat protein
LNKRNHTLILIAVLLTVIITMAVVSQFFPRNKSSATESFTAAQTETIDAQAPSHAATNKITESAHFVGSETCTSCHQSQHQGWQQSHHSKAFAPASVDSVVGDFSSVSFNYSDGIAIFEQQQIADKTQYQIRLQESSSDSSDNSDALENIYPVVYTLGVFPLQQYILETHPGNYQVFAVAWDAREAEQGGQRWMDLSTSSATDKTLHWRQYFQNWNSQCASCHTTNFETNAAFATNTLVNVTDNADSHNSPAFSSTWSEPAVSCESCHGPAGRHLQWADNKENNEYVSKGLVRQLATEDYWQFVDDEPIARRLTSNNDATGMPVIDGCANCHSLRQPISTQSHESTQTNWLNNFEPTRVREPLYFADGQIREEDFVYGSFLQSKMSHAGVTCLNCHDAHSGLVKGYDAQKLALPSNDGVCAQCHRADVFAVESHHHHPVESESARCVSCHMPERIYMGVDARRDHSFQIPSPALSQLLDTPNVCTDCHNNNSDVWAAEKIEAWRAASPVLDNDEMDFADWLLAFSRLNNRLAQASTDNEDTTQLMSALTALENKRYTLLASTKTPAMKKSMLLDSMPINHQQAFDALVLRLSDNDVVVRLAAISIIRNFDISHRQQLLMPLLKDPIKSVRFAATLALADLLATPQFISQQNNRKNKRLLKENVRQFIEAYEYHGDLLGSQMTLADINRQMKNWDAVVIAYQRALQLVPSYVPALVNLADIYRLQQADNKAEPLLLKAIAVTAENARQAINDPGDIYAFALQQQASVEYALGLLYARAKNYSKAIVPLDNAVQLSPANTDYFYASLLMLDALGERSKALELLRQSALTQNNEQLTALLGQWQP